MTLIQTMSSIDMPDPPANNDAYPATVNTSLTGLRNTVAGFRRMQQELSGSAANDAFAFAESLLRTLMTDGSRLQHTIDEHVRLDIQTYGASNGSGLQRELAGFNAQISGFNSRMAAVYRSLTRPQPSQQLPPQSYPSNSRNSGASMATVDTRFLDLYDYPRSNTGAGSPDRSNYFEGGSGQGNPRNSNRSSDFASLRSSTRATHRSAPNSYVGSTYSSVAQSSSRAKSVAPSRRSSPDLVEGTRSSSQVAIRRSSTPAPTVRSSAGSAADYYSAAHAAPHNRSSAPFYRRSDVSYYRAALNYADETSPQSYTPSYSGSSTSPAYQSSSSEQPYSGSVLFQNTVSSGSPQAGRFPYPQSVHTHSNSEASQSFYPHPTLQAPQQGRLSTASTSDQSSSSFGSYSQFPVPPTGQVNRNLVLQYNANAPQSRSYSGGDQERGRRPRVEEGGSRSYGNTTDLTTPIVKRRDKSRKR